MTSPTPTATRRPAPPSGGGAAGRAPGSALARWSAHRAAAVPFVPPVGPVLVVVPHPDDEVLLAGGLITRQRRRGAEVVVAAVTDGEAAYPDVDRTRLAGQRRGEQGAALRALGADRPAVRLGLPDGAVAAHEPALAAALADLVHRHRPALVVAPWWHDGHPDHDACGRAARAVGGRLGVPVVGGLFWTWHWADGDVLAGVSLRVLRLDADEVDARRRAIACHRSQLDAGAVDGRGEGAAVVLEARHLEPLDWAEELYVAPA